MYEYSSIIGLKNHIFYVCQSSFTKRKELNQRKTSISKWIKQKYLSVKVTVKTNNKKQSITIITTAPNCPVCKRELTSLGV